MKRAFDFVFALCALVVLMPIIFVVAILVASKLGRPILFVQLRPGLRGRPIKIYKFRSMNNARDASGQLLSDAKRLTPFGLFLRRSSLDELPQLYNVLRGDLSLVGPRPLLMNYLPLYSLEQMRRHDVRPGITGWAQVNGRNAISWEEKFNLDVWYVDNRSMMLDLRIILLTIKKVIARDGISAEGEATMPPFTGTKKPE
ncbi:sugar transferase [Chitinibacter sp. ZOR0017]|uniref:sugar transferase n=1 Tax=Chitinibacter sp. ZOR0017 TaxID=1339254 RepID=UPI00064617AF|nr:sugar transferase [Chitinibacter sp. ZOR0017]